MGEGENWEELLRDFRRTAREVFEGVGGVDQRG